jgi:hypothetical protein
LDDGEIAINQSDGKLYYHTAAGGVASFASVPSAHKATHATGGSDALSPADIGALTQADADSRYVNVTGDTMSGGLTINAATPLTVTGGRTFLAADSEPYGVGVKYVSSGGAVYFGATDGTSAPGAQISKAGGVALMSFTNAGAASIPGTLTVGGTAVVVSSDPRLSDARSPLSHAHGNITNAGAIGTTASLPIITTTSGVLTTGAFGTASGSFCQGNDSRLSDARAPLSHTQAASTITDFATEAAKYGPVTSVNGLTGAVTISAGSSISDGSKGDITVSGSGATWTINANAVVTADIAGSAVTYAKIQNVSATDKLLGRSTAGAGVVEEITCTAFGRSVIAGADAAAVRTTINAVSKSGDAISGSITVTGNVGIGTASPGSKLDVVAGGGQGISCVNNGGAGTVNYSLMGQAVGAASFNTGVYVNCLNATYNYGVRIINPPSSASSWAIYSDATAQSYFAGSIGVGVITPTVKLDVSGSVRASTGILFGTDTATANTLADYEEGTWTPSFISGFSSVTVTSAVGRYIKIGKSVTAHIRLQVSAFTGNAAQIGVSLPFTASTGSVGSGFLHGTTSLAGTAAPLLSGPDGGASAFNIIKANGEAFTASDLRTPGWTIGFTVLYTAD